eukprot:2163877-Pleurochrysis_carterae.AAC.1
MAHGHNTHASAVAAGYRQFSHGGDRRPLHYVHVWMLAQRAPKVKAIQRRITFGWPDTRGHGEWIFQLPAYTTIQARHVLTNEQHVAELLRERILRDSESKGTPANFSAV